MLRHFGNKYPVQLEHATEVQEKVEDGRRVNFSKSFATRQSYSTGKND